MSLKSIPTIVFLLLASGCASTSPESGEARTERMSRAADDAAVTVADMLRRVAGVRVSETPTGIQVRVRGANTTSGYAEPLFVMDGLPLSGAGDILDLLNPRDVASIRLLQDAEASIWGLRGANGVIEIKTKTGR